jgi:hypothetical protein
MTFMPLVDGNLSITVQTDEHYEKMSARPQIKSLVDVWHVARRCTMKPAKLQQLPYGIRLGRWSITTAFMKAPAACPTDFPADLFLGTCIP